MTHSGYFDYDKSKPKPSVMASVYGSKEDMEATQESVEVTNDEAQGAAQKQDPEKSPCCTSRRFLLCSCLFCCLALVGVVLLAVFLVIDEDNDDPQEVAACGDCHCIVDTNATNATCPATKPQTDFSTDFVQALREQQPLNALEVLSCDPYVDDGCGYDPPLEDLGEEAVCGLHYTSSTNCTEYSLQSYVNRETAEAAGAFVTHENECGACSTVQDLSVYLEYTDMTTFGTRCGTRAVASVEQGQQCFEALGFTPACAAIWTDNARNTGRNCAVTCLAADLKDVPFNGEPPTCPLNDCLLCDEEESGPIFQKFAGRTRRSSGLLSAIARKCSEIADIQHEVCPVTTPL